MRFKVGQKVRIRKDLKIDALYSGDIFVRGMVKFKGKKATIEKISGKKYSLDIDKHHYNWTDEMLKPAEFTKDDLQEGDIATRRDGTKMIYHNCNFAFKNSPCLNYTLNCFTEDLKDIGDDKECDIIKVERPVKYKVVYKQKDILDDKEKEYLENVVKPFKDRVEYIKKVIYYGTKKEFIKIALVSEESINLPNFKEKTMYKNMESNKEYTLEELGLQGKN